MVKYNVQADSPIVPLLFRIAFAYREPEKRRFIIFQKHVPPNFDSYVTQCTYMHINLHL